VSSAAAAALDRVVGAAVAALAAAGVRHVCACPGSRSTPLAIKLSAEPRIKLWVHLDERSAAFYGLGLARAAREPVALLATSGTAAANFYPAVVEASLARVPLVVLTADRPHELRDNGAPQTTDQLRLYGSHARWFFDLPEPLAASDGPALDEQVRLVRALAARAVATAQAEPAGPVHLNWPFRDPLIPIPPPSTSGEALNRLNEKAACVSVQNGHSAPSPALAEALAGDLAAVERGLIVVGPQDDPHLAEPVVRVAERFGYPILADGLSGLRSGAHDRSLVVETFDAFLRDPLTCTALEPDIVLRTGAFPTSKPLQQFLHAQTRARHLLVDPGGWRDPDNDSTDVLHVDPVLLCEALADQPVGTPRGAWADEWLRLNALTRESIAAALTCDAALSEGRVFLELADLLADGALIYAGNSMPVRDLDTFLPNTHSTLRCLSNRGANGIDGVVSSALGASAAHPGPVVLVIGDISFYHDLNGLLAASKHHLDLLVVLINNDGGGIFSFLPQAGLASAQFELLFGTPHGLAFRPFVEAYGGHFVRVADWPGFGSAVREGLARGGLNVVEVPTERGRNVQQHRDVWRLVSERLRTAMQPAAVG
jgi:2-succinyl-5-enolpyruvyl-6-hydroxy-3-cyclohexene-1-carboxylate synthase